VRGGGRQAGRGPDESVGGGSVEAGSTRGIRGRGLGAGMIGAGFTHGRAQDRGVPSTATINARDLGVGARRAACRQRGRKVAAVAARYGLGRVRRSHIP
jgi:hypothetical protein